MHLFFISLLVVVTGGILTILLNRHFTLMKSVGALSIASGCLLGLYYAGLQLIQPVSARASFDYLHYFTITFQIDALSAFFLVLIFGISLLAAIYSFHYMHQAEKSLATAVNYLFFSLLVVSMALVVTAANVITFMFSWEIMSLSSFFLVIHNYQKEENRKAGYLYFVFSHVGAMFILTAFGIMYCYTGSFDFGDMAALTSTAKIMVFVFAFIGFGSKAGVFPFHVWLPHAHPAAPSHISAVMSGIMIKTGVYGILRIYALLNFHTPVFGEIVLIAGMVSGILGVVYALGQHDLKRLLAYSSVENIGIILIGIGIGMIGVSSGKPMMALFGFTGGMLHMLNHAIFKSLLFMGAGMVQHKTGSLTIDALGGLLKKMKITGGTFLIGSLAISGLPPFNGFVSEFLIYLGGFEGTGLNRMAFISILLAIVSLAVIGGLALACFTKVFGVVFQGEARSSTAETGDEKELTMLIPMLALAGACVLIGVFPRVFVLMAIHGVSSIGIVFEPVLLEPFIRLTGNITMVSAIFFAFILVALAARLLLYRGKIITRSGTWGCGFTQPTVKMQYTGTSYAASILAFFSTVAPLREDHSRIEGCFPGHSSYRSKVNDVAELYMNAVIVHPVLALFAKLRWIQHGDIHLYIGYILLAIIVLLFFV
ncbi:MAG: hydrogenase [Desulfobacteraceae bacterium A6]|nr:MAG: hydrogenase [Desulfobacteraceae bacterium A6]